MVEPPIAKATITATKTSRHPRAALLQIVRSSKNEPSNTRSSFRPTKCSTSLRPNRTIAASIRSRLIRASSRYSETIPTSQHRRGRQMICLDSESQTQKSNQTTLHCRASQLDSRPSRCLRMRFSPLCSQSHKNLSSRTIRSSGIEAATTSTLLELSVSGNSSQ